MCEVFLWICSKNPVNDCFYKVLIKGCSFMYTNYLLNIPFCTRILRFRWPRLKTIWSQIPQSIVNWRKSVSVEKVCVCIYILICILRCRSQGNCFCVLRLAFKSSTWQADFHEFQASQGLHSEPLSLLPHPRDKRCRSKVAKYKWSSWLHLGGGRGFSYETQSVDHIAWAS